MSTSNSTPPARTSTVTGIALGLLAFALYATHDAAIKTLGGSYSPFQVIFFVVLLSFPVVMLMLLRDPTEANLRPRAPAWTLFRTATVVIGGFCAFYAFSVLPLTQTYAILFATPMMITILSVPLLGETVRIHRWMAVIAGLIGVLVVLRPGTAELGLGHAAALVAAFCGAMAGVIMRKTGSIERRVVLLVYPLITNFIVMLCILPFVYKPMPVEDLGLILLVAVLAVCAMSLMIRAYTLTDAALVAPMQYSQIIWATLFGWLFFDETSDMMTFIGAGIIIASGAYIVLRESGGNASENQPVLKSLSRRPEMGGLPGLSAAATPKQVEPQDQIETPEK
ncbi:MAG: DMT family transporter [Sulfitobacter sp.]